MTQPYPLEVEPSNEVSRMNREVSERYLELWDAGDLEDEIRADAEWLNDFDKAFPTPHKTDAETAAHIREYIRTRHDLFSWPTDAAGYDQHVRFVRHRNDNWRGGTHEDWVEFCLSYADSLDPAFRGPNA